MKVRVERKRLSRHSAATPLFPPSERDESLQGAGGSGCTPASGENHSAKKSILERLKLIFAEGFIAVSCLFGGVGGASASTPPPIETQMLPMQDAVTAEHNTPGDVRPPPQFTLGESTWRKFMLPPSAPTPGDSQSAPVVVVFVEQIAQSQTQSVSAKDKEKATNFLSQVLQDAAKKLEEPETFAEVLIDAMVLDTLKDFLSDILKKLRSGVVSKGEACARLTVAYFLERIQSATEQGRNPLLVRVRGMLEKIRDLTAEKGDCTSITTKELAQRCSCSEAEAEAVLQLLKLAKKPASKDISASIS